MQTPWGATLFRSRYISIHTLGSGLMYFFNIEYYYICIKERTLVIAPSSSLTRPQTKRSFPIIQLICLFSQSVGLEPVDHTLAWRPPLHCLQRLNTPSKSRLNPLPTLPVLPNLLPCPKRPSQQSRLPAEEQPPRPQERIRREVSQRARLHHRCQVGNRLLPSTRKFDGCGFLGRFESVEHPCAVRAEAVGEEDAQAAAQDGANGCVGGDGGGAGAEGVAVGLLEAVFGDGGG